MKNIIKASLSLFSIIALLIACSGWSATNPIIGTVTENEIPSEPKMSHAEISEDLEKAKSELTVKNITGLNGEKLSVDSAVNIVDDLIVYDHSYFVYNSSDIFTVKKGDKLENGLICTDAETVFSITSVEPSIYCSDSCFSGELTLTGTIHCFQNDDDDPFFSKGDMLFIPDADNKNVPARYDYAFSNENAEIDDEYLNSNKRLRLGNISDLPSEYASLISDKEYTNTQVTIKDIHLSFSNYKTDLGSSAVVVDMKVI